MNNVHFGFRSICITTPWLEHHTLASEQPCLNYCFCSAGCIVFLLSVLGQQSAQGIGLSFFLYSFVIFARCRH